jgi:hypothetical protein
LPKQTNKNHYKSYNKYNFLNIAEIFLIVRVQYNHLLLNIIIKNGYRERNFMKLKFLISFVVAILFVTSLVPLSQAQILDSTNVPEDETFILDGQEVIMSYTYENGIRKATATTKDGELLAESTYNTNNDEVVIDGEKVSKEDFDSFVEFAGEANLDLSNDQNQMINSTKKTSPSFSSEESLSSEDYLMAPCSYKSLGPAKKRTTWVPKTGVAAVATAISIAIPGTPWKIAWAVAGVIAGSTNTLYYTVQEFSCSKNKVYYLKTTRKFYKNSNYTGYITQFSVYGNRR